MPKRQARTTEVKRRPATEAATGQGTVFWSASVLFVLSGAAGLAYEVIWFKRFSQLWGNSALAAGAVVAAFLFGLGAGAYRIGRFADRVRSPLLWYGLAEAGIAVLAVALPFEIGWLIPLAGVFYRLSMGNPLALSLIRAAATLVLLGPPCFLMGGTLPLLIRPFATSGAERDRSVAWFYAVNTLGAAAGCYLTGFHLLPTLGLVWTNLVAVATDLAIAAAAVLLAQSLIMPQAGAPAASADVAVERAAALAGDRMRYAIALAAGLAGCASLVLQMVWTRQLALILGGSTYAFSAMLFAILVGIGLGSLVCEFWFEGSPAWFPGGAIMVLLLAGAVAACERLIPALTFVVGSVRPMRASQAFNGAISIVASALLELLPALGMGALFPVLVALSGGGSGEAGRTIGEVYAANTLGAMVGALATPLLIIPLWGTATAVALAVGMYAAITLILIIPGFQRNLPMRIIAVSVAAALVWASYYRFDPLITDVGMYLYGDPLIADARTYLYGYVPGSLSKSVIQPRYFKEGAAADVFVVQEGDLVSLRVNGKADASTGADMSTQLGSAYLPRFMRPAATEVLVIGFGSGTTAGASLLFPGTKVTCVEIEPAVFAASRQFWSVNHRPEQSPDFSIVFDDARSYLQQSDQKFDLILAEASNPWMAGIANVFTREFYRVTQRRLKPGGMLAQWVQLYSLSPDDYAMVIRTLAGVFPHLALVGFPSTADTMLLASDAPIGPSEVDLRTAQSLVNSLPAVRADLKNYFSTRDVFSVLLWTLMLDDDGVRRLARDSASVNNDLNVKLEFDAPRSLFDQGRQSQNLAAIMAATEASQFTSEFEAWGGTRQQAGLFHKLAYFLAGRGRTDLAKPLIEFGLAKDPQNLELQADAVILSPSDPALFQATLSAMANSDAQVNALALSLLQNKRYDEAAEIFQRLGSHHPDSAVVWNNLADCYKNNGSHEKAQQAFAKAISLDPFNDKLRKEYEAFLRETSEPAAAK